MKKILVFCLATTFTFTTKVSTAQTEVTFYTNMGNFVAEMYDTLQPITSGNFVSLVNAKFYDGVIFHRVISNFMIQGGDPTGTGSGGPGYTIADEFNPLASNVQKTLSMANSGPNTGGSQFFINLVNNTYLNPKHPVFGIVTADFSVVQAIGAVQTNSSDKPLTDVVMDSVRVTNSPVGINHGKYEGLNIDVFPNPTEDYINIDLGGNFPTIKKSTLNIINLLGKVVYTTPIKQQNTKVKLNSKGVYFVHLTDEQGKIIAIKKITLQ